MKNWVRCTAVALTGALSLTLGSLGVAASTEKVLPVVSYGLGVLSARTDVAVSAPVGNEVAFSAETFARGLNLSRVDYITVKSLPDTAAGELLLGSSRVAAGQTVSGENLSFMTFVAASEEATHASFTFTANGGATPTLCNVYLLERVNYTPTVSLASGLSLNVSTHRDMVAHGRLSAYDPDGDELLFEVVSYPKNGSLLLTDAGRGSYEYTPQSGYVGSDCFSYVARDRYGNYSAAATVNLKVSQAGTSVTYADMEGSDAYNAALFLTEAGVMSGTQVGNRHFFYPEQTVSRVEFLVMAMNAAGMTEVPECEATVFADDGEIPDAWRGYVATAHELGYITGSLENGKLCFRPNEEITRAQAAVILSGIVGSCEVAVVPTFADGSSIPVWAVDAIYSLGSAGILTSNDGYIEPTAAVTRADTARMLSAVMQYLD